MHEARVIASKMLALQILFLQNWDAPVFKVRSKGFIPYKSPLGAYYELILGFIQVSAIHFDKPHPFPSPY